MHNYPVRASTMLALALAAASSVQASAAQNDARPRRYIVESSSVASARGHVLEVGGEVSRELEIIRAVSATLTAEQARRLRTDASLRLFPDRALETSAVTTTATTSFVFTDGTAFTLAKKQSLNYPALVGADLLKAANIDGKGVTIAVLDSGFWSNGTDTIKSRTVASVDLLNGAKAVSTDPFGHGTHIASIAAGDFGIAPRANVVIVRAFDAQGAGSYSNVIAGLDWIVANQQKYHIRVVNLSFGAPPQSNYWDDPLNKAVMAAWRAGIVVVAAAGNEGPDAMTIGVPGNVPYVITVGALTDNYTPFNQSDDKLASFSSTGPTFEGFVKPEVVAPGGHLVASMWYQSYLANIDPGSMKETESLFTMSGTSQAAAITSGVAALMLQADPTLTPDMVKCRLMASARTAVTTTGTLAYSVFQQGAGLINAVNAVNSAASGCANQGIDISADLAGTAHFGGPANQDAAGNYYVMNMAGSEWGMPLAGSGYTWSAGFTWNAGYSWSGGAAWSSGYTWSKGYTWSRGYTWSTGYTWSKGYTWSRTMPWWDTSGTAVTGTKPASIASWVPNE